MFNKCREFKGAERRLFFTKNNVGNPQSNPHLI